MTTVSTAEIQAHSSLPDRASNSVRILNPGYFALVMATGIVSVGLAEIGLSTASGVLLALASLCYVVLVVLYVWRWVAFRKEVAADFTNPGKAFAYFTFVAGSGVLGTRLLADGQLVLAIVLFTIAGTAWIILGYAIPWGLVLGKVTRPLLANANGTWFIWTVASQSVAVLAATLQPMVSQDRRELAIIAVFCWSVGAALYVTSGMFVGIRLMTYDVKPVEVGQPYWVSMGATAITVLAGARIVEMADAPMIDATRGLVAGLSVLFWCFGTWLWPLLIAAGIWRHVIHKVPLGYEAPMWSMVFPLGMYGVASMNLGIADSLPLVESVGHIEIWLGIVVWAVVFLGLLLNLYRTVIKKPQAAQ